MLFALLVGLRLHGFSISVWRDWTDRSPPDEVLLGRPRAIRIDDYAVILPLAFAQELHDPPFPVVNSSIGLGQNMLLPFSLPVWHPLALFRPDTWGFFVGADVGMAWRWWSRTLALLGVAWLLLLVVTEGRALLSAFGALALVESPFFQLWGLRPAPVTIHTGLLVLAALGIAFGHRRRTILLGGLLLGYAAVGFALALYPPFQVPLAYLGLVLFAAVAWTHRAALDVRFRAGWRAAGLLLAVLVAGAAAALFYAAAGDAIARMASTVYPGQRVSLGGGRSLPELLAGTLGVPLVVNQYGPLVNACEAAGFWLLSPPLLAAAAAGALARRERPDGLSLALAAALAGLVLHATLRMPEMLARASLWSYVPGRRSVIALGLVEVLLVARLLSRPTATPSRLRAGLALAWGAALAGCGAALALELPDFPRTAALGFAALNAALVWLALGPRRGQLGMPAFALASIAISAWFNPLVRGGSEALQANALARAVVEVDAAHGGETVWTAFANLGLGNLFRAVGVASVSGVHPVPQLELWQRVDPAGDYADVYDRYAHVLFSVGPPGAARFTTTSPDAFRVVVDPASADLRALGVTHLVVGNARARKAAERGGAVWVRSVGSYEILREPWVPPPPEEGPAASGAAAETP